MKSGVAPIFVIRLFLTVSALAAVMLPCRGDEAALTPPAWTPQQKASFDALDRALARFDALLARDDDPRHQAATRTILDGLQKRRDALRAGFDQAKYDDLRTEVNLQYQRLAAWMAPPAVPR
jgi:hypothetical protein